MLVNALAHADFSLNGMRILPFGMILDDFKSGVSKIRNRIIARTFREINLMEEWGSGFKRVIAACRQGGYLEPVWQEVGRYSSFSVSEDALHTWGQQDKYRSEAKA